VRRQICGEVASTQPTPDEERGHGSGGIHDRVVDIRDAVAEAFYE
jgi:hypothetical protein